MKKSSLKYIFLFSLTLFVSVFYFSKSAVKAANSCTVQSSFTPSIQCLAGGKAKITWKTNANFTPAKTVIRLNKEPLNIWGGSDTGDQTLFETNSALNYKIANIEYNKNYNYRISAYSALGDSPEICTTSTTGIPFNCSSGVRYDYDVNADNIVSLKDLVILLGFL